jgi:hypothetical protein
MGSERDLAVSMYARSSGDGLVRFTLGMNVLHDYRKTLPRHTSRYHASSVKLCRIIANVDLRRQMIVVAGYSRELVPCSSRLLTTQEALQMPTYSDTTVLDHDEADGTLSFEQLRDSG